MTIRDLFTKEELIVLTNTPEEYTVGQVIDWPYADGPHRYKITRVSDVIYYRHGTYKICYGDYEIYGKRQKVMPNELKRKVRAVLSRHDTDEGNHNPSGASISQCRGCEDELTELVRAIYERK